MKIYIEQDNWDKIISYAKAAYNEHECEIGGMAVCVKDGDGDWIIQDPVILKQDISRSNCVLDKDELAKYYTKTGMSKKYKNADYRFLWWHSHHTMAAFWSSTDLTAIEEFNEGDFSFALVVNLKEEYKMRISVWHPIELHEDVELEIIKDVPVISKAIRDEVEKLCVAPVYTTGTTVWGSGYNGYANQLTLSGSENKCQDKEFAMKFDQVHVNLEADLESLGLYTLTLKKFKEKYNKVNGKLAKQKAGFRVKVSGVKKIDDAALMWPLEMLEVDKEHEKDLKILMYGYGYGGGYDYGI